MKKKLFLTEADKKQILADKEKVILESFAKTFNKIKRLDENELNEYDLEAIRKQLTDTGYPPSDEELSNIQGAINMGKPTGVNEVGLEPQTKDVAYYIKKALEVEPKFDFNVDKTGRLSARYRNKHVSDITATDKFEVSDEDGKYTLLLKTSVEHEEDEDGASAGGENFFGFVDVYMEDENNPLYGIEDENLLVKWVNDDFGVEALPQEIVNMLDPETLKKLEFQFKGFVDAVKDYQL